MKYVVVKVAEFTMPTKDTSVTFDTFEEVVEFFEENCKLSGIKSAEYLKVGETLSITCGFYNKYELTGIK